MEPEYTGFLASVKAAKFGRGGGGGGGGGGDDDDKDKDRKGPPARNAPPDRGSNPNAPDSRDVSGVVGKAPPRTRDELQKALNQGATYIGRDPQSIAEQLGRGEGGLDGGNDLTGGTTTQTPSAAPPAQTPPADTPPPQTPGTPGGAPTPVAPPTQVSIERPQGLGGRTAISGTQSSLRDSGSNQAILIPYGIVGVSGITVYENVGKVFEGIGETGNIDFFSYVLPFKEAISDQNEDQLLLMQDAIALGEIEDVTFAIIADDPMYATRFRDSKTHQNFWGYWQQGGLPPHRHVQAFTPERDSTARFTDIANVSWVFWLDLDDPKYRGKPLHHIFYYLLGVKVSDIERFGDNQYRLSPTKIFSNKPISILTDYLVNPRYGPPEVTPNDIDFESFYQAQEINNDTWHYQGTMWNLPFPDERNFIPGESRTERIGRLPAGVATPTSMGTANDNLYLTDTDGDELWRIDTKDPSNVLERWSLPADLDNPRGMEHFNDNLYIIDQPDTGNARIWSGVLSNPGAMVRSDLPNDVINPKGLISTSKGELATIIDKDESKQIRRIFLPDTPLPFPEISIFRGQTTTSPIAYGTVLKQIGQELWQSERSMQPGATNTFINSNLYAIPFSEVEGQNRRFTLLGDRQLIIDVTEHDGKILALKNANSSLSGDWQIWEMRREVTSGRTSAVRDVRLLKSFPNATGLWEIQSHNDILYGRTSTQFDRNDIDTFDNGFSKIGSRLVQFDSAYNIAKTHDIFDENIEYTGLSVFRGNLCISSALDLIRIRPDDDFTLQRLAGIPITAAPNIGRVESLPLIHKITGFTDKYLYAISGIDSNNRVGTGWTYSRSPFRYFGPMIQFDYTEDPIIRTINPNIKDPNALINYDNDLLVTDANPDSLSLWRISTGLRNTYEIGTHGFDMTSVTAGAFHLGSFYTIGQAGSGDDSSAGLYIVDQNSPNTAAWVGGIGEGATQTNSLTFNSITSFKNELYGITDGLLYVIDVIFPNESESINDTSNRIPITATGRIPQAIFGFKDKLYFISRVGAGGNEAQVWRVDLEAPQNSVMTGKLPTKFGRLSTAFVFKNNVFVLNNDQEMWLMDPESPEDVTLTHTITEFSDTQVLAGAGEVALAIENRIARGSTPREWNFWRLNLQIDKKIIDLPSGLEKPAGLSQVGNNVYCADDTGDELWTLRTREIYNTYGEYIEDNTEVSISNTTGLAVSHQGKFNGHKELRTLRRHRFNGAISTQNTYIGNLNYIVSFLPGAVLFRDTNDKFKMHMPDPKVPTKPVMHIDKSKLIRGRAITVNTPDLTTKINKVITRFPDIEHDFAGSTVEFPRIGSILYNQLQNEDQGLDLTTQSDLVGGHDRYHAYAFSSRLIIQSRRESYSFVCSRECYLLEPGDIIRLTVPWMDIDVYVRVATKVVNADFTISISGVRYSRFDWDLYLTDRHPLPLDAEIPA